jgi:hypothetical protein
VTNPLASRGKVLKLSSGSGGASAERSDNGRAPEGRLCRNRRPEVMGANAPVAVTERQHTSPWSSVVSFFLEGLALYAASYSAMPPTLLKPDSELRPAEPCVPEREGAACERDRRFSLITSSATPEPLVNEDQNGTEWSLRVSAVSPEDASHCGHSGSASLEADHSSRRHWLMKCWLAIASSRSKRS